MQTPLLRGRVGGARPDVGVGEPVAAGRPGVGLLQDDLLRAVDREADLAHVRVHLDAPADGPGADPPHLAECELLDLDVVEVVPGPEVGVGLRTGRGVGGRRLRAERRVEGAGLAALLLCLAGQRLCEGDLLSRVVVDGAAVGLAGRLGPPLGLLCEPLGLGHGQVVALLVRLGGLEIGLRLLDTGQGCRTSAREEQECGHHGDALHVAPPSPFGDG